MGRLRLLFQCDDPASTSGSAWIAVNHQFGPDNVPVISHDCGGPIELERVIRDLKAELDEILGQAKVKFAAKRP